MTCSLAIVIPAFKSEYFGATMASIARQSCKKFTLYIGDDNSPDDIYQYVRPYESVIDIRYHRFEHNYGATRVVDHWKRCIDLTHSESWIWLFSDDDVMDEQCVELFYKYAGRLDEYKLIHFNVDVIDQLGNILIHGRKFPPLLSVENFFRDRVNYKLLSFMVEYIFPREFYINKGIKRFDLGWCSDDATWIQFAVDGGIFTITDAKVKWRSSNINISSTANDDAFIRAKSKAVLNFMKWSDVFFKSRNIQTQVGPFAKLRWLLTPFKRSETLTIKEKLALTRYVCQEMNLRNYTFIMSGYLFLAELKTTIMARQNYRTLRRPVS